MNSRRVPIPVTAVLLLVSPVLAQNVATIPYQNAAAEGTGISFALARPGFQLTQTIYESRFVYRATPSYSAVLFRPDSSSTVPTMSAVSRHLTLRMSGIGVPSPELASTLSFAANRGIDHTTVLDDRLVAFPAESQRPTPAVFDVVVPLDQPFPLTNIAHLCVETETRDEGTTIQPWYPDAEFFQTADWTVLTTLSGANCPAGSTGFSADYLNGDLFAEISALPDPNVPIHPAVAFVGTSTTRWGSIPLPLHLDLFGAPGCTILTDSLQSYVGMSRAGRAERFTLRLPVPRNFGLLGQSLHTQLFLLDPTVNAFGIRTSAAATFTFSSPPDPRRTLTLSTQTSGDHPALVAPNLALILGVR